MPAASACAVSSPVAASGTCRLPPTICESYTGSLSAAPDQPRRGTPTASEPSSEPPEARQGRLPAMLDRFKRQRPAIQQQALYATLAEHPALPYDAGLVPTCFDYGIFLANGGMDLPHWLTTAPHWARSAVVVGRSSALRAIKQHQL